MKKFIIALFTLLLFQNCCLAVHWYEFANKSYIDLDTIEKNENGICKAWVKLLNDGNIEPIDNKKVWFTLNTIYIDLKNKKHAIKDIYFYDLNNKNISDVSANTLQWDVNIPGSLSEYLYDIVLKYPRFERVKNEEYWVNLSPGAQIDINSILMTNSECCNVSIRTNAKNLKDVKRKTVYVKYISSINLVKKRVALIDVVEFDKNNKVINEIKYNNLYYQPIGEDSLANDAIKFIYELVDKLEKN